MVRKKQIEPPKDVSEGNTANDILMDKVEDEEIGNVPAPNAMEEMIKQFGKTLFKDHPQKTSVLSYENIDGCVEGRCVNKYLERYFGYRSSVVDTLIAEKETRIVSKDGFGIASFIESVRAIQATIEQHQVPEGLRALIPKIR